MFILAHMIRKQTAFIFLLLCFSSIAISQEDYRFGYPALPAEMIENPRLEKREILQFPVETEIRISSRSVNTKNGSYTVYENLTYQQALLRIHNRLKDCEARYKIYQFDVNTYSLKIEDCPPEKNEE